MRHPPVAGHEIELEYLKPAPRGRGLACRPTLHLRAENLRRRGATTGERGRVAGKGSCNRFIGTVEITGTSLALRPLGTTRMACAESVMTQEAT
jgi:hypothetical protein